MTMRTQNGSRSSLRISFIFTEKAPGVKFDHELKQKETASLKRIL